eukprot:scaffold80763_cov48-Phaeocystis_antarctica.AAC.3
MLTGHTGRASRAPTNWPEPVPPWAALETRWPRLRPAGAREASLSARSRLGCPKLRPASASQPHAHVHVHVHAHVHAHVHVHVHVCHVVSQPVVALLRLAVHTQAAATRAPAARANPNPNPTPNPDRRCDS